MVKVRQLRAAGVLLGWSQQDVADRPKVALNTINNLETSAVDPKKSLGQNRARVSRTPELNSSRKAAPRSVAVRACN